MNSLISDYVDLELQILQPHCFTEKQLKQYFISQPQAIPEIPVIDQELEDLLHHQSEIQQINHRQLKILNDAELFKQFSYLQKDTHEILKESLEYDSLMQLMNITSNQNIVQEVRSLKQAADKCMLTEIQNNKKLINNINFIIKEFQTLIETKDIQQLNLILSQTSKMRQYIQNQAKLLILIQKRQILSQTQQLLMKINELNEDWTEQITNFEANSEYCSIFQEKATKLLSQLDSLKISQLDFLKKQIQTKLEFSIQSQAYEFISQLMQKFQRYFKIIKIEDQKIFSNEEFDYINSQISQLSNFQLIQTLIVSKLQKLVVLQFNSMNLSQKAVHGVQLIKFLQQTLIKMHFDQTAIDQLIQTVHQNISIPENISEHEIIDFLLSFEQMASQLNFDLQTQKTLQFELLQRLKQQIKLKPELLLSSFQKEDDSLFSNNYDFPSLIDFFPIKLNSIFLPSYLKQLSPVLKENNLLILQQLGFQIENCDLVTIDNLKPSKAALRFVLAVQQRHQFFDKLPQKLQKSCKFIQDSSLETQFNLKINEYFKSDSKSYKKDFVALNSLQFIQKYQKLSYFDEKVLQLKENTQKMFEQMFGQYLEQFVLRLHDFTLDQNKIEVQLTNQQLCYFLEPLCVGQNNCLVYKEFYLKNELYEKYAIMFQKTALLALNEALKQFMIQKQINKQIAAFFKNQSITKKAELVSYIIKNYLLWNACANQQRSPLIEKCPPWNGEFWDEKFIQSIATTWANEEWVTNGK